LLYDGTACEQKTKNAKSAVNSMFTALFILSDYNKFYLYPFVQNKNIKLLNCLFWRGSGSLSTVYGLNIAFKPFFALNAHII